MAKLRWLIERDYQDLKQELGLGHYEGRGWRGFHHHATRCIIRTPELCRAIVARRSMLSAVRQGYTLRSHHSRGARAGCRWLIIYSRSLHDAIGTGDLLSFIDASGTTTASVTGTQAMTAAAGFNNSNGAQCYGGSQYTLVNLTVGQFTKVVLSQTALPSFEAANFEYAATNVSVPEPASLVLLGRPGRPQHGPPPQVGLT